MTKLYKTLALGICLALGASTLGCAQLNPKTERQIFSALEAQEEAFQKCYKTALKKDRDVKGTMELKLHFKPDANKPDTTKVEKTKIKDGKMKKCVEKAARKIKVADKPGASVEGHYVVDFKFAK